MAGGIGDLFGGIGSIASSFINAGNQRRANDIAEQNSMMQYMLGNRNIDMQELLGNRNIDLQKSMFEQNFGLQKDTAKKNYDLADLTGSDVLGLIKSMASSALIQKQTGLDTQRQGLDTQRNALGNYRDNLQDATSTAQDMLGLAKASKFDAQGNEVYFDPQTNSYKVRLSAGQQQQQTANDTENLKRSTVDQQRAREGNIQNQAIRSRAMDMFKDDANEYQFGQPAVNEGQLAGQIQQAQDANRQSGYSALRSALATQAIRGGNASSIKDIGQQVRSDPNSFFQDSVNANMQAAQFAQQQNQAKKDAALKGLTSAGALATFSGDAYNQLGEGPNTERLSQQADAGGNNLLSAMLQAYGLKSGARSELAQATNAFGDQQKNYGLAQSGYGDDLNAYASNVSGAMNSRANAMINALSNGAAAQGNALQSGAAAQGNAISNLASALASAYGQQASAVGSAMTNQAKLLNSQKMDLSGLGKIGSGFGGLVAALANNSGEGSSSGTTSVNKSGGRVF